MKQIHMFLIAVGAVILIVFNYHEVFLTNLDKITMPFTEETCNSQPNLIAEKLQTYSSIEQIEADLTRNISLQIGGKWSPNLPFKPASRIAIIVPYRDRQKNLEVFLSYIHRFLTKQNIIYRIYIVEPVGGLTFNKGISMNAGFMEALKDKENWNCFIFHDVDIIPENNDILYQCDQDLPKLIAVAISAYNYRVDGYFKNYFGGVTAFTKEQFKTINGFSNLFYGWGLEDDDARNRVISKFKTIKKLDPSIGRFYANCHKQQSRNPDRFIVYLKSKYSSDYDGLNSLAYEIKKVERTFLYTKYYISYASND